MSQITQCPSCATAFRVGDAQLRIADGWVRCGNCEEVFDATEHILDLPFLVLESPAPASEASSEVTPLDAQPSGENAQPGTTDFPPDFLEFPDPESKEQGWQSGDAASEPGLGVDSLESWSDALDASASAAPSQAPSLDLEFPQDAKSAQPQPLPPDEIDLPDSIEPPPLRESAAPDEFGAMLQDALVTRLDAGAEDAAVPDSTSAVLDSAGAASALGQSAAPTDPGQAPVGGESQSASATDAEAEEAKKAKDAEVAQGVEDGFAGAAPRNGFWQRPVVRIVMAALTVVLLATLGLQVLVHERDRIAAAAPGLRPVLRTVCVPLRCVVGPVRRISDIVIDSSAFEKGPGDSYTLSFTIKSQAPTAIAMPAIELTLTDAQDQPVVRRVMRPENLAAPVELPAGGEWSGSVPVTLISPGERVAGYRMLAFYP